MEDEEHAFSGFSQSDLEVFMDRRAFLKWQMKGIAALAAGPSLFSFPCWTLAAEIPDIGVVKGSPGPATRAAVNLVGGIGRFVKPGQKVVIKPNISFAQKPEAAANTHPEIVRELLVMCREAGAARVRVLDHSLQNAEDALSLSGIRAACDSVEAGLCHHLMSADFYVRQTSATGW